MALLQENLDLLIATKKAIKDVLEVYSTDTITDLFSAYSDLILNLYTSKTCLNSLFEEDTSTSLKLSTSFPWSNVVGTAQMFKNCANLTTVEGISDWDMSKVLTVLGMFNGAGFTELDLSALDWSSVRDASRAFQSMPNCTIIKLPKNLAPIKATHMFYKDAKLATVEGLDTIDMSNCKTICALFYGSNFSDMTGISNWNTSNVEDMSFIFSMNTATTVDLSKWNTSNVTNMVATFLLCENMSDISFIGKWDVSNVTSIAYMCNSGRKD